jgi:dihydropyrimidine dehydrogenase (NAD+) subunit PreA
MNNLAIDFAGIKLVNPFLLASGPLTRNEKSIREALESGWAGVVTKTISLHPPISPTPRLYMFNETDSLWNIELISQFGYHEWEKWIKHIKNDFPKQVVIASIMGSTNTGDWQKLAKIFEQSGADGLELNVSCPHGMPEKAMGSLIGQDRALTYKVTSAVKESVKIPVMVKLTPNVTDITEISRACEEAGADAVSGINTIKSFAGIDIDKFTPKLPVKGVSAYGGYGGAAIKPIALRCVSEIAQSVKLPASAIGGISTWQDAVEFMLLGASSVQVCTAAITYGVKIIDGFKRGLSDYLKKHKFSSVTEIVGKSKSKVVKYSDLQIKPLHHPVINKHKCEVNCFMCEVTCRMSGFNAITKGKDDKPVIKLASCEKCGLCFSICPYGAITMR